MNAASINSQGGDSPLIDTLSAIRMVINLIFIAFSITGTVFYFYRIKVDKAASKYESEFAGLLKQRNKEMTEINDAVKSVKKATQEWAEREKERLRSDSR